VKGFTPIVSDLHWFVGVTGRGHGNHVVGLKHRHVLLMQAHAAAGNPAQALAAYERLRVRLADELGTALSPETESAFLEILAARPRS